ncbi:Dipeptidyl peptidase 4 [Marasmius crinis-equi]|uniref:Dipeptidyl peptidase IV n=1 Tax=Marasmius crinis-equi TaxID=585013 RepID=A0ABR3F371_9AGAR
MKWTLALALASAVSAQKLVTFEDAFSGNFTPRSTSYTWTSADTDGTYIVQDSATNDLVFANVLNNDTQVFVNAQQLGLDYDDYEIQGSRENVLFATNHTKQWRHSYNASYWVFNREAGTTTPLVEDQGADVQYATWSNQGDIIAFVRQNDLYIWNGGEVTRITDDGTPDIFNAIPDWVYEEEIFGDRFTLWFSPDGEYLAFLRFNETGVETYTVQYYMDRPASTLAPSYPSELPIRYPKVGTKNPTVEFWLLHVSAVLNGTSPQEALQKIDFAGQTFPEDEVIVGEVAWVTENHGNVIFRTFNRVQDLEKLVLVDVESGEGKVVRERDGTDGWIDDNLAIQFVGALDGGNSTNGTDTYYVDLSDESGWMHIYLYPVQGGEPKALTQGEWEVTAILKVDAARGIVYYQSTEHDSTERHVYAVSLLTAEKTPLVDDTQPGYWTASFSSEGGFYLLTYSGPDIPHQELYSIGNSTNSSSVAPELVRSVEDNAALRTKLTEYTLPQISWTTFNESTPGYSLNFIERLPANFDSSKKYPVLFDIYGGPGAQEVSKTYKRVGWEAYISSDPELQYIHVSIDGRGTGFKGREFRSLVTKQLGKFEAEDQVNAARYYASTRSYVDADHIVIWGWSYGGYLTSKVVETNSGAFSMGLITAPVTDWRFYDSMYTERYMKLPTTNGAGYNESAVTRSAGFKNITGGFLIQHGTGDDNVHFQNSASLMDLLVREGVSPEQMHAQWFTDSDHSINLHGSNLFLYKQLSELLYLEKIREGPVNGGHQWSRRGEIWKKGM